MSKRKNVPLSTLHHRARGRPSKEKAAQGKQYLTPSEEITLEKYLKLMSDLGNPVRIKFLPSLAFSIARQRSTTERSSLQTGTGLRASRSVIQHSNQKDNEVKVRQSTRSIILGKAKVTSYEDIEEARAKRAAKEIIKGKGKRRRKRKSTALEVGEPEQKARIGAFCEKVIKAKVKRGRKCQSAALEPEPEPELAKMTAPVARMV
ncbi:hypothetical protein VE03_00858 [Pseudogymnoascus sp. 23342-1-I1]|nr:hypothetical protein VE03_00858 [Pseudogymnoascus sp. 23342-1-I1]